MIDLSIITVTHQSADFIEDLIISVISGAVQHVVEHIVVDNGSTDGTIARVEHYASYVMLIKNKENLGFSAANNQAFVQAKGRYILFLNPDMKVQEGSLDRLMEWMQGHADVGIVGCQLVDSKGEAIAHRHPDAAPRMGQEALRLIFPSMWRKDRCLIEKKPREVEVVLGAFMLVRREILDKLGFAFDPRYFLTYEDYDLCREAKRLGYKVMYHPGICCFDFNSRSFVQKSPRWIFHKTSRGVYTYFRKWGSWYAWLIIALCIPFGYAMRFWLRKK